MTIQIIFIALFLTGLILGIILAYYFFKGRAKTWYKEWKTEYESQIRKDAVDRSRAVLKGKVGEQFAPFFSAFDYEPSDARFIGSPVDYIIFEGHSEDNPKGVTFADIKTGKNSKLNPMQRGFKRAVERGKVSWETIRLEDFDE